MGSGVAVWWDGRVPRRHALLHLRRQGAPRDARLHTVLVAELLAAVAHHLLHVGRHRSLNVYACGSERFLECRSCRLLWRRLLWSMLSLLPSMLRRISRLGIITTSVCCSCIGVGIGIGNGRWRRWRRWRGRQRGQGVAIQDIPMVLHTHRRPPQRP